MRLFISTVLFLVLGVGLCSWIAYILPPQYNPFAPLSVSDPPSFMTQYKLRRLDNSPQACLEILDRVQDAGAITFARADNVVGNCPLKSPVRVQRFGLVTLNSSFLASCRLALSSAMFISQIAKPQAQATLGSPLVYIEHAGGYVCREQDDSLQSQLSEHASGTALDVAGFRLADGRNITVSTRWQGEDAEADYLHLLLIKSCPYFGNVIGPDHYAAHVVNYFHFGMRWFGFCH